MTKVPSFNSEKLLTLLKRPIILLVVIPFLLFAFYQLVIASDRYESQAQMIVKEPDAASTLDPAMALLSGFGVSSGNTDTELVKAYIYSNDMLNHLEQSLQLRAHFSSSDVDIFSRLSDDASSESFLEYYMSRVTVEIDEKSSVIRVAAQAFSPEFAYKITKEVVDKSEFYINEIGNNLAKRQLEFIEREHKIADLRFKAAKAQLIAFQQRHDLLDPEAEGMALQEITYSLEAQIAAKQTELRQLLTSMSDTAPRVVQARSELASLRQQLQSERSRLTRDNESNDLLPEDEKNLSVSEILARFTDYKIEMELALKSYTSSQVSLEKSRIEAYRQLKFLVTVESPTLPDDARYPDTIYNITLFLVINLMLFGIGKILVATVAELK